MRPENRRGNRRPPPAETRWKKGQSGNPGGRPRAAHISKAYREVLESPYPGDRQRRTYAEVIAERVVTQAAKGEISAVREITDRDEGKPRQPVELGANASALLSLSDEEINRVLIETLPNFLADLPKQMFAEMMERTRKARLEIEGERVVPLDGQEDGSDKEGG